MRASIDKTLLTSNREQGKLAAAATGIELSGLDSTSTFSSVLRN
jgi:hypothetical protein